jgi:hypothetical protein
VPFQAHVQLLRLFLAQRAPIAGRILELLNAQQKPLHYQQDRVRLSRLFEDCFFKLTALATEQSALRGQLKAVHRAHGFIPADIPGMHNEVVDPAEMVTRAFQVWRMTRWPGRNGRARYAQTLFNLFMLQSLELLSMRLWDQGVGAAGERLAQLQAVLDELWKSSPADQPVLLRDARWLIPLAQSPANVGLAPYLQIAELIAESFTEEDRVQIHRAAVMLAGGHLRSQLRHYFLSRGETLSDRNQILRSRRSNALDFAMAIQSMVPLLKAYAVAIEEDDSRRRLELAGAICQGISPDPDLFVNHTDLLVPYSMIENLFIAVEGDDAACTHAGQRHVQLLQEYAALIDRLATELHEDCANFRPLAGSCSPYGVIYGFSNNLLEHMAVKTLQPDSGVRFSLEDAFDERHTGADKLAWVSGWRKLPHVDPQVLKMYEYPQQFAEEIFERISQALGSHGVAASRVPTGRLSLAPDSSYPELAAKYFVSSDEQVVAEGRAQGLEESRLLHDREEGELLACYRTAAGWTAMSKDFLTDELGEGRDAKVVGLPPEIAGVVRLMCPGLVQP